MLSRSRVRRSARRAFVPPLSAWPDESVSAPYGGENIMEVLTTVALVQSSSLSFLRSFFSKQDPCLYSSS